MRFELTTLCLGSKSDEATTVNNLKLVVEYMSCRKAEKGLTKTGEEWIRATLPKFILTLGKSLLTVTRDDIRAFLATVDGVWMRHSHFRAIRAFYNWAEREGRIKSSPCYKMQAPKTPKLVLPRPTLSEIRKLINLAPMVRDKGLISLMADTGFRKGELAGIQLKDINWESRTIKVWGKGSKERIGKFSDTTERYLREHLASYTPNGNVWGLNYYGIGSMLSRLKKLSGITCNPHSFRRAWAIESIKGGVNLLDIQVLGGWDDLEMVKRYAREVNSEDAVSRYKPLMQSS